jgi:hypothetical protein
MRVDVSDVAPPGCRTLAMEVIAPAPAAAASPVVLFCFPGGGMSRRYFDLTAAGYSFAEYASARGFVMVLVAGSMPADVHQALVNARSRLLAVVGYASMVPGSAGQAAARIDVPVFAGVGEHDIAVDHHAIPAEFPASRDVTLFVLQGAGHNQNVEAGRELLWARMTDWAGDLARQRAAQGAVRA